MDILRSLLQWLDREPRPCPDSECDIAGLIPWPGDVLV